MTETAQVPTPDERGIDVAILAFIGAKMAGESNEAAAKSAETMLDLFGFKKDDRHAD